LALKVEVSKNVMAAPATVWQLLDRPTSWKAWWDDCVEAIAVDRKGLKEGSTIELVLRPSYRRMSFFPVVDVYTENKILSLACKTALVDATLTFLLQPDREGCTQLRCQLSYGGVYGLLARLTGQADLVRLCHDRCVRGLKRMAERMV
jgi:hypothetical protein